MKESAILMGILVFLFITGCTYAKYLLVEIDEPSNISGRGTIDDPLQGLINNRNSKCADLVRIIKDSILFSEYTISLIYFLNKRIK